MRRNDAAKVYDSVPSLHDANSAAIIAKLHIDGGSTPWALLSEDKRELKAPSRQWTPCREQHQRIGQ
jgi:transposase